LTPGHGGLITLAENKNPTQGKGAASCGDNSHVLFNISQRLTGIPIAEELFGLASVVYLQVSGCEAEADKCFRKLSEQGTML